MDRKHMALFDHFIDSLESKLVIGQHDVQKEKIFLQKQSSLCENNLYTHLSELLAKLLRERPKNIMDNFEMYSYRMKEEILKKQLNHQVIYNSPIEHKEVEKLSKLFQVLQEKNEEEEQIEDDKNNENSYDEFKNRSIQNLLDLIYLLEHIDISFSKSESILLNFSIQKLVQQKSIINVRFWGKILGSLKNYYIIEAKIDDEEFFRRLKFLASNQNQIISNMEEINDKRANEKDLDFTTNILTNTEGIDNKEKIIKLKLPQPLKCDLTSSLFIPSELIGKGLNNTNYFVCNSPGLDEWIELPSVTPQQIILARQIIWNFTGCLTTSIRTVPYFPGNESNYLRAQIARISAATLVSPTDYFTFKQYSKKTTEDKDNDYKETDYKTKETIIQPNLHYEPLPFQKYQSLSNWCHHSPNILRQGRITWWDSIEEKKNTKESGDEIIEDEESENGKINIMKYMNHYKEIGLPLLSLLSNDNTPDNTPVWSIRSSFQMQLNTAVTIIRSNVWTGASSFTKNKEIGNVYVGAGYKYDINKYHPPLMFSVQFQYIIGSEIMELRDPTV